jgi:glucose/arabinose dehydrogenase
MKLRIATLVLSASVLSGLGAAAVLAQGAPAAPVAAARPQAPPTPSAQDYTANCAGCHGTDLAGGRGPSLFADALLNERTDAQLLATVRDGIPEAGMPAFKGQLSDDRITQILAYLRIRQGQLRGRPSFLPNPDGQIVQSEKQKFRIEVVAANLETPWGEVFLPDGRMLVTERTGHIRIIDHGKLVAEPVKGTPVPWVRQDGGFFDIALDPDYKKNGWIYLAYSEVQPGTPQPPMDDPNAARSALPPAPLSMTRWVRGRLNANNEWVDQQDVFKADPSLYTNSVIHYGTRFLFDGKGHLFFTMGERGEMANAQNLAVPLGKVHRINVDGSVPKDNPFVNTPGADPTIWTYGHRNPEGLAFDPVSGLLWESEHGPTGGDEVNVIQKGHNYGWGVISMGLQPGIDHQHQAGMDDPITYYTPSIGPSGMSFYTAGRYPGWKNSLFLSALAGQKLIRYEVSGSKITHEEVVYKGFGRTRDVITGPDGYLYILIQNSQSLSNSPGMVIRLMPVE